MRKVPTCPSCHDLNCIKLGTPGLDGRSAVYVALPPTLRHIGVTLSRYAYGNGSTNDEDFAYRFPAGTDFNNEIRAGSGDGPY
jgi:hypothetical protein